MATINSESNPRRDIPDILRKAGYSIIRKDSDVSDPFAWSVVAEKDGYEIRIQERSKSLCDVW